MGIYPKCPQNEIKTLANAGDVELAQVKGLALMRRIHSVVIGETFVKAKLDRFNREFAAKKTPELDAQLGPIVQEVFGDYMARNFERANKHLSNAFAILRKSR